MTLKEQLVSLLKEDEKKRYVYLSKNRSNMDQVGRHVNDNVDLEKVKVTLFMVHPIGVGNISGDIDGVYADEKCTTDGHIRRFIKLNDTSFVKWINPETLEVIEDVPPVLTESTSST